MMLSVTPLASTPLSTLPLRDALPICQRDGAAAAREGARRPLGRARRPAREAPAHADRARGVVRRRPVADARSEEHTSELQSRENLVCRLLLEKKQEHHPAATETR